jgi:hypothetical protein
MPEVCEIHGVRLDQCEACTRKPGECDLGGCIATATHLAFCYRPDGELGQIRPICERDIDFARSLGYVVFERMRPMQGHWVRGTVYALRGGHFGDVHADGHLFHTADELEAGGWTWHHGEWVRRRAW